MKLYDHGDVCSDCRCAKVVTSNRAVWLCRGEHRAIWRLWTSCRGPRGCEAGIRTSRFGGGVWQHPLIQTTLSLFTPLHHNSIHHYA